MFITPRRPGRVNKVLVLLVVGALAAGVLVWRLWGVIFPEKPGAETMTVGALGGVVTAVVHELNAGKTPAGLGDLTPPSGGWVDGWGHPLTLTIGPGKGKDLTDVVVRSSGMDGIADNTDDFVASAEIIRLLSGEFGVNVQTIQRPGE